MAGLLGLALTACGRKGPLEPPPNATNAMELPAGQIGATESEFTSPAAASPLAKAPKANAAITIPEKSFVLDPLL
jgi:predicted small lipoprotein YifL